MTEGQVIQPLADKHVCSDSGGLLCGGFRGDEVVHRQGGRGAIPAGDFVDDGHGILVAAFSHEKLGRFIQSKTGPAEETHDRRYPAHGDEKVPPTHVVSTGASLFIGAGEIAENRPGNQIGQQLSERPVHRQHSEQILVRAREELKEDGRVNGEVPAHADGPQRVEDTYRREGG